MPNYKKQLATKMMSADDIRHGTPCYLTKNFENRAEMRRQKVTNRERKVKERAEIRKLMDMYDLTINDLPAFPSKQLTDHDKLKKLIITIGKAKIKNNK